MGWSLAPLLLLSLVACERSERATSGQDQSSRATTASPKASRLPEGLTLLGTTTVLARQLLVAGTRLYYDDGRTIQWIPRDGGDPTKLASTRHPVLALLADEEHIYWLEVRQQTAGVGHDDGPSMVSRVANNGGTVETIAQLDAPLCCLAANASAVYWLEQTSGAVKRWSKQKRTTSNLATLRSVRSCQLGHAGAVAGDSLYLFDSSALYAVPLRSGAAVRIATDVHGLSAYGQDVLWVALDPFSQSLDVAQSMSPSGNRRVVAVGECMTTLLASGDKFHLVHKHGGKRCGQSVVTLSSSLQRLRDIAVPAEIGGVAAQGGHLYYAQWPPVHPGKSPPTEAHLIRVSPP